MIDIPYNRSKLSDYDAVNAWRQQQATEAAAAEEKFTLAAAANDELAAEFERTNQDTAAFYRQCAIADRKRAEYFSQRHAQYGQEQRNFDGQTKTILDRA